MESAMLATVVIQWIVLLILALGLIAVVRQIGVIHQRIAPAGALMMSSILKQGDKAPELQLVTTDGRDLSVGGIDPDGFSTLIMFVSPDCPVCDKVVPAVKAIAREERAWLRLIFAGEGNVFDYNALRDRKGLRQFPFVISAQLGLAYAVAKLPYGVVVDEHGIVASHGLTNSREHIESLLEAKRTGMASIQHYLHVQEAAGVDALFAGTNLPGARRNG